MLGSDEGAVVDRYAGSTPVEQPVARVANCPGLGCDSTAREYPDGRVVCDRTGWVYGPDGSPRRDPDPDLGGIARAAGWS